MSLPSLRPRGVGELLDGAFRLYRHDFGLYAFTAALAALPTTLVMILLTIGGESTGLAVLALVLLFVGMFAALAVWAALMHQMNERLDGNEPGFVPSVRRALRLLPRVVLGGILAYVVLFGAMFLSALAIGAVGALSSVAFGDVATVILTGVAGLALLLTIGVAVFAGLSLFLPVIVVEGSSAYRSIRRGFSLSKGGRIRITTVLFLAWILLFVPLGAVYALTGTTQMLFDPDALAMGAVTTGQLVTQQILALMASAVTTPFVVACLLLLFYDQKVRREAFDLEAEAESIAS